MNRSQKVVLIVGLFLILLSGLFLSYEGEWRKEGDNLKKHLGHYFIFSPLNSSTVVKVFNRYWKRIDESSQYCNFFSANIISSRFIVQIITILLLTIGLVFLLGDPKYDKKFPIIKN